ncbi:MAG: hypothetical protein F6K44_32495, partial [Moorea sp. SIO3E2]|nr:hypothetical protein [Moorena sp. SIO3E2]
SLHFAYYLLTEFPNFFTSSFKVSYQLKRYAHATRTAISHSRSVAKADG